jgi:hypothetical protein
VEEEEILEVESITNWLAEDVVNHPDVEGVHIKLGSKFVEMRVLRIS